MYQDIPCQILLYPPFSPRQELDGIKKNKLECFKNVEVDETNVLEWKGLIVPVSYAVGW